jgi:polyphosphate kinase 2 (PPK2 family)
LVLDDTKEDKLDDVREKLSDLDTMYAHNRYGVLICLGMDTSGKDSLIREVLRIAAGCCT